MNLGLTVKAELQGLCATGRETPEMVVFLKCGAAWDPLGRKEGQIRPVEFWW